MRRRLFNALCLVSLMLAIATAALWARGYWVGDSVSWYGHRRYELWSQTGQFGFYVSPNQAALSSVTWTTIDLKPRWTSPSMNGSVRLLYPDQRIFKGFESRLVNGLPEVEVPSWLALLVLAILPMSWLGAQWQRRNRLQAHRCHVCGYDLRATTGPACPECGEARPAATS